MQNKTLTLALLSVFILSGCAGKSPVDKWDGYRDRNAVISELTELEQERAARFGGAGTVNKIDGIYLGDGQSLAVSEEEQIPDFNNPDIEVAIADPMPLSDFIRFVSSQYNVEVDVSTLDRGLLIRNFQHAGRFANFLKNLANHYDVSWKYASGEYRVSSQETKVYELALRPGSNSFSASISNSSGGNSEGGETYSNSSGMMNAEIEASADPWDEVESALENLLPGNSFYSTNPSFGTITVSASPSAHAEVGAYVETLNGIFKRQVALNVNVFTLELSDENAAGFNLDAVYQSLSDGYGIGVSGPLLSSEDAGQASVSVLEGSGSRWEGSTALLRILREWGETSQVVSTSGVVMNNQEMPITDLNRRTYLERRSVNQVVNAGVSAELIPGQVVTGFSMLVSPQILSTDEVMMQYHFSLSTLVDLVRLSEGEESIQGPDVDERKSTQRTLMPIGSTLVIAGFQRDEDSNRQRAGATGYSRDRNQRKTVVFVTITANKA